MTFRHITACLLLAIATASPAADDTSQGDAIPVNPFPPSPGGGYHLRDIRVDDPCEMWEMNIPGQQVSDALKLRLFVRKDYVSNGYILDGNKWMSLAITGLTYSNGTVAGTAMIALRTDGSAMDNRSLGSIDLQIKSDGKAVSGTMAVKISTTDGARLTSSKGTINGVVLRDADLRKRVSALAPEDQYPCHRGMTGDGQASTAGDGQYELVGKSEDVSLLWKSEEDVPGSCFDHGADFFHPGGFSHLIGTDKSVFTAYTVGSGSHISRKAFDLTVGSKMFHAPHDADRVRMLCSVEGDDILACVDSQTGMTRWRAIFKEKGIPLITSNPDKIFRYTPDRLHRYIQTTPCVYGERIYHQGTAGWVWCLNVKDGSVVWESKVDESVVAQFEKAKAAAKEKHAKGNEFAHFTKGLPDSLSNPCYADGVLACGFGGKDLVGLDAQTGKRLWHLPEGRSSSMHGAQSTVRWVSGEKEYLLTGVGCIDPRTGEVLWKMPGGGNGAGLGIAHNGQYMLMLAYDPKSKIGDIQGLRGYRLTEKGPVQIWKWEDDTKSSGKAMPLLTEKYAFLQEYRNKGDAGMNVVELETGKVVSSIENTACCRHSSYTGNKYIVAYDGGNVIDIRDPMNPKYLFRILDPNSQCVQPMVLGTRLLKRGTDGVVCYELRKNEGAQP